MLNFSKLFTQNRVIVRVSELFESTNFTKPLSNELLKKQNNKKLSEVELWKKRENLVIPIIQRFENLPLKTYYAPEWEKINENPLKNYGTTPEKWEFYNKIVWPKNYIVPETGLPKAREVFHCRESVHYSPKRMWRCCQFVRRMNVVEAINQLKYKQIKGTLMLAEIIEEAMKRAKEEFYITNPENMFVAEAFAIQTQIIKGRRRHAREQWFPIRYRYINIFVRLEEGQKPPFKKRYHRKTSWELMDDYYKYLRNREIKYSL